MTLKLSDNAVLLNQSSETDPTMVLNHPLKHIAIAESYIANGDVIGVSQRQPVNGPHPWQIYGISVRVELHFMAYDRTTIRNNTFHMVEADAAEIFDRYGILADTYGAMIDPKGADGTTELVIEGNTFTMDAPVGFLSCTKVYGYPLREPGSICISSVVLFPLPLNDCPSKRHFSTNTMASIPCPPHLRLKVT